MMLANISAANFSRVPIAQLTRYGAQAKSKPYNSAFLRSLKKVFSSLAQLRTSSGKAAHDIPGDTDSKVTLLGVQKTTSSNMDGWSQPGWRRHSHWDKLPIPATGKAGSRDVGADASAAYAPYLQRHDGAGILSKTENLVFRTRTTPGKAMRLPVKVGPRLPAMVDPSPMPDEVAPPAPTPLCLDREQSRRVAKAVNQQVRMLTSKSMYDADPSDVKVVLGDILTSPETLRNYAKNLFFCRDRSNAFGRLMLEVHQALQSHKTAFSLSSHLTLLQHLAHACAGDAERALAALHAMQAGDFLTFSADMRPLMPGQHQPRRCQAQAHLDALGIAGQLSLTSVKFKMLLKLIGPKFSEQQHCSLQRLLQAVAQIEVETKIETKSKSKSKSKTETETETETEQGRQVDLWHHAMRAALDVESGQASLAQLVLHIESAALQKTNNTYADLSTVQKSALLSWNNGFREQGKGSELALMQARLCKMVKYFERASHMQELRNVHFDQHRRWHSIFNLIDAKARIVAMRLNQSVGRKKSPPMSLATFGVNSARMMSPEVELLDLYLNMKSVISLLHAPLQEALGRMSAAEVRQQLQDPLMPLPALVEHAALLAHWSALLAEETPLDHRLDAASIREIAGKIAKDYDCQSILPTLEEKLKHWIGSELKIDDLKQWVAIHHALVSQPDACTDDQQIVEDKLSEALRKASSASTASSFPVDLSMNEMRKYMCNYLREHNVGNTVSTSNGSTVGANTKPIMLSIRKLNEYLCYVLPLTVTPAVDVGLTRVHNAVINFGSTTHGFEIFIGTQKQKSASLGAAFNVNMNPFLKYMGANTGGGAATGFSCNHVKTRGVMVRAKRGISADGSCLDTPQARAEIVAFTDLMFEIAQEKSGTMQAEAMWGTIAERFFNSEILSIGWQTQKELMPHLTGTFGLHTRLGLGVDHESIASAGFSTSHTVDFTPSVALSRKEKSGAARQIRSSNSTRNQQITSFGAVGAGTSVPIHTSDANTESLSFPQISNTLNFMSADKGTGIIFRTLLKQGELSALFTLRDMELRDAQYFCQLLQQPERYMQYLSVFNARYGVEHGERKLEEFIEKTKNWAGPGQFYLMRSRLKDDVRAKLDELMALADTDRRYGVESMAQKEIVEAMTQLLCAEASWVPIEIMALETQTAREGMGINFGVQLAAQDAVVSNRQLSYVAAPLPVANKWVGES